MQAVSELQEEQLPDVGDVPTKAQGSMPSGSMPSSVSGGRSTQTSKNVPNSVAQHEHIIKNQGGS